MVPRPETPSGVILVLRMDETEQAYKAALGAIRGGIDAVEITLTVPDALEIIDRLKTEDIPLGAGTVLSPEQVEASVRAGAEFIVAPNTDPDVVSTARRLSVPVIPGALTPTEVYAAHLLGADAVKVFPARCVGGASYLEELRGPFPDISYVVSGAGPFDSAPAYFAAGAQAVCVGRDIFDPRDVATGDLRSLASRTRDVLAAARP